MGASSRAPWPRAFPRERTRKCSSMTSTPGRCFARSRKSPSPDPSRSPRSTAGETGRRHGHDDARLGLATSGPRSAYPNCWRFCRAADFRAEVTRLLYMGHDRRLGGGRHDARRGRRPLTRHRLRRRLGRCWSCASLPWTWRCGTGARVDPRSRPLRQPRVEAFRAAILGSQTLGDRASATYGGRHRRARQNWRRARRCLPQAWLDADRRSKARRACRGRGCSRGRRSS